MDLKKIKQEREMRVCILITSVALMLAVMVFAFSFAVNSCVKEIEGIGLKNIVEEVWEGKE